MTRYNELNKSKEQEVSAPTEQPTEVKDFLDRNKTWCNKDTPMNSLLFDEADALCKAVATEATIKGEVITLEEQLKRVEDRVKRLHPDMFENSEKQKPKSVASSTVSSGSPSTLSSRLNERQRQFIRSAREYGSKLTEEQYANQLLLTGELQDE